MSSSIKAAQEQIRQRAYDLYLARGGEDGRDLEDCIEAEQQLSGLNEPQATSTQKAQFAVAGSRLKDMIQPASIPIEKAQL